MFKRKTGAECISVVTFNTTLPYDGLMYEDTDIEIRPAGLNIATNLASHLIESEFMLSDMLGDYGYHCWTLKVKWKGKYFEFWIYNFGEIMIRVVGPKKSQIYLEVINLLHNHLSNNELFSDIKWSGAMPNKRFINPSTNKGS